MASRKAAPRAVATDPSKKRKAVDQETRATKKSKSTTPSSTSPTAPTAPAPPATRTPTRTKKSKAVNNGTRATKTRKSATPSSTTAPTPPTARAAARTVTKRKASEGLDGEKATKKSKSPDLPTRPTKQPKTRKPLPIINTAPKDQLNVYVFGEGSSGELGLGTYKTGVDVKRPRLNPFITAEKAGIVQIATGGMHVVALTHDNKIMTWGVNDQGALGRDTQWEGNLKDIDGDSTDSEDDDNGLNPKESTPTTIPEDSFPKDTKFTQVAAGDSASFALTEEGSVYGWGTFRAGDGILGFSETTKIQKTPTLVPELKNITQVACGSNHALALTVKGNVLAWGSGQQYQLGRRIVDRNRMAGLMPRELGTLKGKAKTIACGADHSFVLDKNDKVWAWGLNNYGETGVTEGAGEDEAAIGKPTVVKSLAGKNVVQICGGGHHSVAVTKDGDCLAWGRVDGFQTGIKIADMPTESLIYDERKNPRILKMPMVVPGFKAKMATAGTDSSIAITNDGKAFSWGFSANYQTGQGTTDDVEAARHIDNTAVRGKVLSWAGAGGQYSVLAAVA
ncbi:MAG: hypothetical protein M1833_000826 [Piccolia ochrophora]|nr:MAG: hypothetical protein M1833_000826 [Piccolia ochrophora]